MWVFEKALKVVLESAYWLGSERIDITDASNRILAEDIKSDRDMPPFNKSTRDGFACLRADLANELAIVETIPAGYVPQKTVEMNQCAKIMTGGIVPAGADCVIMKEYVRSLRENTIRFVGKTTSDNIFLKGDDIIAGDIILRKGTELKPQHISVLASVGNTKPLVSKRPKVAVIATGNELVEPSSQPGPSQIRSTNGIQLIAQIESMGAIATNYGIAKDTNSDIDRMLKIAAEENDVVIFSGGVSVGDFDIVPDVLKQNNINLLFEKIAVKPGKPTVFGLSENVYCFGLPGNPVSTFVQFEFLVKPFLYKLMGHNYRHLNIHMHLDEHIKRKKTEKQSWIPVVITEAGKVKPVEYHGSAHINALCSADGLISFDIGVAEIKKETIVQVRLI